MNNLSELIQALTRAEKIVIVGHIAPDGDSIGSVLAMGLALQRLGKEVCMLTADPIPETYNFLSGVNDFKKVTEISANFDLALILDCTDLHRCGDKISLFLAKVPMIVNIDHHISNQFFGQFNYVDAKASATGEIIYKVVKELGVPLTVDIATCIYTAIVMDTGSFKYDNTSVKSHRITAKLIETGIDVSTINTRLFEEKPFVSMKLLGEALQVLKISSCRRVAWMSITREIMERTGASEQDTDGIINYPKMIAGIEVGLLFREIENNKIKIGFRSKGLIDVNQLAGQFNGGGHPRAAGAMLAGNLNEIEAKVINAVISALPS